MKVVIYHSEFQGLTECFAQGVGRFNHKVVVRPIVRYRGREKCDVAVTIGAGGNVAQVHKDLRAAGVPFLCISDGFIRRRKGWKYTTFGAGPTNEGVSYWGVARNGLHAYGEHVGLKGRDPRRWEALGVKMRPWCAEGKFIVIGFQPHRRPWTVGVPPEDRSQWFPRAIKRVAKISRHRILFKPHPHDHKDVMRVFRDLNAISGNRMQFTTASWNDLLAQGVRAMITFDSNLAVDAAIDGVPFWVGGRTMADPVANRNLDLIANPVLVDRTEWRHWFGWTQFNKDEMRNGLPWKVLVEEWEQNK